MLHKRIEQPASHSTCNQRRACGHRIPVLYTSTTLVGPAYCNTARLPWLGIEQRAASGARPMWPTHPPGATFFADDASALRVEVNTVLQRHEQRLPAIFVPLLEHLTQAERAAIDTNHSISATAEMWDANAAALRSLLGRHPSRAGAPRPRPGAAPPLPASPRRQPPPRSERYLLRRLTPERGWGQSGDTNQVTISARFQGERNCSGRKLARSLGWGLRVVGFRHGRIRATLHLRGAALRKKRYSVAGMTEGSRASAGGVVSIL